MNDGLPFTTAALDLDAVAIRACLTSGLIVIVEVNKTFHITGIVSAHTSVMEAHAAYGMDCRDISEDYAIIVPTATNPMMFYNWIFIEELIDAAGQ